MTTTQLKIKNISRIFRIFFQIIFVILPILHLIAWIKAPSPLPLTFPDLGFVLRVIPEHIPVLHNLSWSTRFFGFLITGLPLIALEFILYYQIRLFRLYEQTEIFTLQNVNYLKKTGYALLIMQIVRPITEGLITALVTWGNPPGHRMSSINVTGVHIGLIITAFLIILISWIMAEGYRLCEEQQLTI